MMTKLNLNPERIESLSYFFLYIYYSDRIESDGSEKALTQGAWSSRGTKLAPSEHGTCKLFRKEVVLLLDESDGEAELDGNHRWPNFSYGSVHY
jgi:hypothetical protein